MISIGNDIVALNKTNAERTKEEIFYSKILAKSEIALYTTQLYKDLAFENFVWLVWSIKESVYKFQKRNQAQLFFAPTKIIIKTVELPAKHHQKVFIENVIEHVSFNKEECFCCTINFNAENFFTRSFIFKDLVYTVANNTKNFENIYWGIEKIESNKYAFQSQAIRNFTVKKLSEIFPGEDLLIEKAEIGFPFIQQKPYIPLSFTHHGNFVAYCFLKE